MRDLITTLIGKTVRQLARLRGGGSALPGLVVERLDARYMSRVLGRLPHGVIAVSGTNGKTTTTKMIVEMLEARGMRVFTNRTGSNFSRGVVAAIVQDASWRGRLPADIAVLELDEAHAMYFIDRVPPRVTLLLNVLRDQLDRFGEIDATAALLQRIADATTNGLVVNREDRLVAEIGRRTRARADAPLVAAFGLSDELLGLFPGDDDFHGGGDGGAAVERTSARADHSFDGSGVADVVLLELGDHEAVFEMDGREFRTRLLLEGLYNTFNAAAALSTVRMLDALNESQPPASSARAAGNTDGSGDPQSPDSLIAALSQVRPAFGRGEQLTLDGSVLELVLVKNPAGFRLALASFNAANTATMIAINDQYADGRDISWLWDVDFGSLAAGGVDVVSGARAWDMALRLEHDDVSFAEVIEDPVAALEAFRRRSPHGPRRIYCTYTAMLALRARLAELTEVEDIW